MILRNESERPSIVVFHWDTSENVLCEIGYGIEEEGCVCDFFSMDLPLERLCDEAFESSKLGCGIGLKSNVGGIFLKGMRPGEILLRSNDNFRMLGKNAARAVKKYKFEM